MTPRVTFNVCLPYEVKTREKWHVASCKILDVHSQGVSKREAVENLKEALELFLVSCFASIYRLIYF
jgi:predicted RNase H-like HicB family nuclease